MINKKELYQWCTVPREELMNHPDRKGSFTDCKGCGRAGRGDGQRFCRRHQAGK